MKRSTALLLGLFLLLDTGYSFLQHYHAKLDGDMAAIMLPTARYQQVLDDPFGLSVWREGATYPGAGRFFVHWWMAAGFKKWPLALQSIVGPIDSIYLSCASAKALIQVGILFLLARAISGPAPVWRREFLLPAALMAPLFQTFGYYRQMGIIDGSITYTFFYALPMGLLLLFFLPFYEAAFRGKPLRLSPLMVAGLSALAVVLAFSGPLVPGMMLVVCPIVLLRKAWQSYQEGKGGLPKVWKSLKKPMPILFVFASACSLYSLYLSTNNAESMTHGLSLIERYARLPEGLFRLFTAKLGPPLLLLLLIGNTLILRQQKESEERARILRVLHWAGIFVLIYLLLLPLGGYREYRPYIIRKDTFLPVMALMIFFFGLSTQYLLRRLSRPWRRWYLPVVIACLLLFTIADEPGFRNNACERAALEQIARSPETAVQLEEACTVMSWFPIRRYEDSRDNAKLLQYWRVITQEKRYAQPE